MTQCMRLVASAWIRTLRCTGAFDDRESITAQAVNSLVGSIEQLKKQEQALTNEIVLIVAEIKAKRQMIRDKKALHPLLLRSKQKRIKLTQLVRKRESFENHLDLLNNSEMDQTLISTVKQTATALKSLGLNRQVDDVDNIMADLEETQMDARDVANIMSSKMAGEDEFDDDELKGELDLILEMDETSLDSNSLLLRSGIAAATSSTPPVRSSMREETVTIDPPLTPERQMEEPEAVAERAPL